MPSRQGPARGVWHSRLHGPGLQNLHGCTSLPLPVYAYASRQQAAGLILAIADRVCLVQVTVHARIEAAPAQPAFESECFECQPKPVPKTFPVCTIRNTPDKPIHCVVWAKEMLFQRLFGRHALF